LKKNLTEISGTERDARRNFDDHLYMDLFFEDAKSIFKVKDRRKLQLRYGQILIFWGYVYGHKHIYIYIHILYTHTYMYS
jgi:hypothetical protein